jgi:polyisoprenoid-binding protein YceI
MEQDMTISSNQSREVAADSGITAGTWTIDPAHGTVGFTVRHLMSRVGGRFDELHSTVITAKDLTRSHVTATIDLASISTGNAMRDQDLRSPRFFNVDQSPTMTFRSSAVHPHGELWIVRGDLTINQVTRPAQIETEFLGVDETGLQGETRIGFSGWATIRRSEFGIDGLAGDGAKIIVADSVTIELDIEAVRDR